MRIGLLTYRDLSQTKWAAARVGKRLVCAENREGLPDYYRYSSQNLQFIRQVAGDLENPGEQRPRVISIAATSAQLAASIPEQPSSLPSALRKPQKAVTSCSRNAEATECAVLFPAARGGPRW